MFWIDIATPKYAVFFSYLIPLLKKRGLKTAVTARYSKGYTEIRDILQAHKIEHTQIGAYGGESLKGKLQARFDRQKDLLAWLKNQEQPQALICGSVVDSNAVAFGLNIPIVNIYDTPIAGHTIDMHQVTAVSRLTIPLSHLYFYPFVLPREIHLNLGVPNDRLFEYPFIDVYLWMKDIKKDPKKDFRKALNIPTDKPCILIREEEYKAHYVSVKTSILPELIPLLEKLNAELIIMPRYESKALKKEYGQKVHVIDQKFTHEEFYPFVDMVIGGGGTMNLEAVCYGIPTISTRSLHLFHDKYLIDKGLMKWTDQADEVFTYAQELLGQKFDNSSFFHKGQASFEPIIDRILENL